MANSTYPSCAADVAGGLGRSTDTTKVSNFVGSSVFRPGLTAIRRLLGCLCVLLSLTTIGCGLRTIPPIRYLPILGKEKQVSTTDVLVRALNDRDVSMRAEAVELLGLLATSPDGGTRKEVASVLGSALSDVEPGLRLQVVEELGRMDPKLANKFLNRALKDPNPFVRSMVLQVLEAREKQRLNPQPATTQAAVP